MQKTSEFKTVAEVEKEGKVTPEMVKEIRTLSRSFANDEQYHTWLREVWKVESTKDLTINQGLKVIGDLKAKSNAIKSAEEIAQEDLTRPVEIPPDSGGSQVLENILEEEEEKLFEKLDAGIYTDLPLAYYIEWIDKRTGARQERIILSAAGIFEAGRMTGLKITETTFHRIDDKLVARAKAQDPKTGADTFGFASKYRTEEKKIETLSTMAIRNALKKLLTVEEKGKILTKAQKLELVKEIPIYIEERR